MREHTSADTPPRRAAARRARPFPPRTFLARTLLAALLCCLALASPAAAGATRASAQTRTRDEIQSARERYASIRRRLARMRRVGLDLPGRSAEGGRLVAHFDRGELKLLRATFYGETGRNEEEYYFDAGRLFFAFTKESRYDKPFGRVVSTAENRFYFRDRKLLRWLDPSGRPVSPARPDFAARETELNNSADDLAARAKQQMSEVRGRRPVRN